jgi:hypothetical protein
VLEKPGFSLRYTVTSAASPAQSGSKFLRNVRSIHWIGLTLLLLALLAALPLWNGPGLVNTRGGGDSPFLFIRLHQLMANLREGVFPARWMPDAAYGLGYPFFNFYASLPYYFAAIFNFLGVDLLASIKIVQMLGFVFAGFALYGWARRAYSARRHFDNRWAAWLAAVAYVYAPFHLINVYVRGDSLSEFYAFIFYPLILWSIDRIFDSPRHWPLLALSYGGLILTHNVSALIFSPFVVLYVLIYLPKSKIKNVKSKIAALALGLALAFALSAFFWLPALGEASLTQVSDVQTTGYFNYAEHFRAANLIQNSIGFDYSITTAPGSNSPFAMGLVQAIATVAGLVVLIATWKKDSPQRFRLFVLIGLALSTFMITPLSKPLWDTLPLLSYTQFPWRFLSIQALFASLAIGYLAIAVTRPARLAIPIGLILVASMLFTLRPDYLPVRADEITPERLQLYEAFTGNIGTTIRAEYLPRTMIPRPYTGPMLIDPSVVPLHPIVSHGEAIGAQVERRAITQQWKVNVMSDKATLSFPIINWPGWQAFVDDQPIETRAAPDLGYIQIDVPRGEHRVDLKLGNTPIRSLGEIISVIALIIIVVASVPLLRAVPWRRLATQAKSPTALAVLVVGAGFVLIVIILQNAYPLAPNENDLTMDFVSKPWLHHNPGGYAFRADVRLGEYVIKVDADMVQANQWWNVTASSDVSATLSLVAPSTHLFGGPSLITQTVTHIQNGLNAYALRPSYALPTGLYYVTVQMGDDTQFLQPVWIQNSGESAASPQFGSLTPSIGLAAVQTQLRDPDRLDVLLQWVVAGVTDANYGISLRLHDAADKVWTSLDTQPGYGFQPTSAWQPDTLNDAYTLDLPNDLPRDQVYTLDVILYRIASKQEVGRTAIDGLRLDPHDWRSIEPPTRNFTAPDMPHALDAIFDDQIQLLGYDLKREGEGGVLKIDLAWQALRDITGNYKVFAHVYDPATETIAAQWDAMPRDNAYPTSRWIANEVVTETLSIPLTDVPPGEYRIAVGLYEPAGRLPVSGTTGIDAGNRRVKLEEEIGP